MRQVFFRKSKEMWIQRMVQNYFEWKPSRSKRTASRGLESRITVAMPTQKCWFVKWKFDRFPLVKLVFLYFGQKYVNANHVSVIWDHPDIVCTARFFLYLSLWHTHFLVATICPLTVVILEVKRVAKFSKYKRNSDILHSACKILMYHYLHYTAFN